MNENGSSNVMEIIKRQKWENLFKRRELVHVDVVKEFYAKMTVIHLKQKDIMKSKVRGIEMEFDHEKSATILVCQSKWNREYIKEVREESKYTKPLEITRRFANDENIMAARRDHELPYGDRLTMVFQAFGVPLVDKKGEEPKRYDFFEETFLTMCKLTRENGIWWIGSGENRRRDDDVNAQEGEAEKEDEGNKDDFDWEAVIDEVIAEGESDPEKGFMMLRMRLKVLQKCKRRFHQLLHKAQLSRRNKTLQESTPRVPLAEKLTF
ncbi:hypothetical protein Dimus_003795 [Dionaea muscipula]